MLASYYKSYHDYDHAFIIKLSKKILLATNLKIGDIIQILSSIQHTSTGIDQT